MAIPKVLWLRRFLAFPFLLAVNFLCALLIWRNNALKRECTLRRMSGMEFNSRIKTLRRLQRGADKMVAILELLCVGLPPVGQIEKQF